MAGRGGPIRDRPTSEKVGLALSGGGFRAAFFHVGVLARLAELGILPKVEVISTVSGGSIVGAAYYIGLKELLESKPDGQIISADYQQLVLKVEQRLLDAVRKNIRGRLFGNLVKNVVMAWPTYSRSDRIGDLYDRYLYKEMWPGSRERKWWGAERQIALHELRIQPHGEPAGFNPHEHGAHRRAKVPILLINATSLNSGHNWRFEAVRMGEALPKQEGKQETVEEVDKNMRLIQGNFDPGGDGPLLPEGQRDFPLALAVSASACVPLLFHPLSISGVYKGIRVELVDGGVQDNQGLQGLLDEECYYLIVSDASGQMLDVERPSTLLPSVAGRSMSIYGDRIRDEQLVYARSGDGEMALMHLRKGLRGKAVEPSQAVTDAADEREGDFDCSEFGVDKDVQVALSRIRTDLDDFSDREAFSLMLDGYKMSERELNRAAMQPLRGSNPLDADPDEWDFGAVNDNIGSPTDRYLRQLHAGQHRFFRMIATERLARPWLFGAANALAAGLLIALIVWKRGAISDVWRDDWSAGAVILAVGVPLVLLAAYLAMAMTSPLVRYPLAVLSMPLALVAGLLLWAWAWIALPARLLRAKLAAVPSQPFP
ncbi:MAG: patatin-like phospholipase family protein [Actinomycetota bacterium]